MHGFRAHLTHRAMRIYTPTTVYKDQLSLTNPRDALRPGERAANNKVVAQCALST